LWLLHVCVERTAKDALAVLYPACRSVAQEVWNRLDWTGLRLGFLYLSYERDGTDLLRLLLKAGELTDRADFRVGCEAFYHLANEIDRDGPIAPRPLSKGDRVAELFKPFSQSAQQLWSAMQCGSRAPG
jgi:hypothetical protein